MNLQAAAFRRLAGCSSNRGHLEGLRLAQPGVRDKSLHAVLARENDPVEIVRARSGLLQGPAICWWTNRNRGKQNDFGAQFSKRTSKFLGLMCRPGDNDSKPLQRPHPELPFRAKDGTRTFAEQLPRDERTDLLRIFSWADHLFTYSTPSIKRKCYCTYLKALVIGFCKRSDR